MEINKKEPIIFIISGKAESGKDLVAGIIKEYYINKKCKKLAYSYYLKQYVKKLTGWDGSAETKPRDFLQEFGVDLLAGKINKNFLINRLCEDIEVYSYFYDVLIITDARLIPEIEIPKSKFKNVITIRINRLIENKLTSKQKNHITETALDDYNKFDYLLENNENYDKLVNDVRKILLEVNHE